MYRKKWLILLYLLTLVFGNSSFALDKNQFLWNVTQGLDTPESAYFDPISRFIYISNIVGAAGKKDGKGYITKISKNGKVEAREWVSGLNAPKGIRSWKDKLYVTDIDEVVEIDVSKGKIVQKIPVAGAEFLNDLAIGPQGEIYASDNTQSAIYVVRTGQPSEIFLQSPNLENPNGLLVDGQQLIVAAWGYTEDPAGRLLSVHLKTKKIRKLTLKPAGNLDGVEREKEGSYLVSDWVAGKVMRIGQNGSVEDVISGFNRAADIGYIADEKILIVPRMGENLVTAYQL